ncbi:T-complex protein 1 subunit eta-like [Schistocerca gregaria]|uniref:T-complex protein 1 subunit eta-like n=1 Tax=Schistocerca gregaria TaxID=7010 RepID=UPI00211DEDA7|nr:T-complex protein 1 subunit eta-like [Schistocerca gregaria]
MSAMLQPGIILLREGTDTSQGVPQLISNINACECIVDIVRTTLGPFGMDKLIHSEGSNSTVTNDGATVLRMLDVVHPAAKTLVEIAKSQDSEVGDGTTSVVLFAGELLKESKAFIDEGMHSQVIIKGFRKACLLAKEKIKELEVKLHIGDEQERRKLLMRCAATPLSSKLVAGQAEFFSNMVVDAVEKLDEDLDPKTISIKKEVGGSLEDSIFVEGVAFQKTFSYAGFEQAPKKIVNPKIALLNVELEIKKEKENTEIRITNVSDYQKYVDAEWNILYSKLDSLISTGANVVLSRLAIGDLATQYFAVRGIFCAGRVPDADLQCLSKAVGGSIQSSTNKIEPHMLGHCGLFEERQVGGNRYNFFTECPKSKSTTIILRGAGDQLINEAERSLHDAIMVVLRTSKYSSVVGGGGAIEMELSKHLHEYARTIPGKQQMVTNAFARALESIPKQLADNAGLDSTDILNQLRKAHAEGGTWMGVNLSSAYTGNSHISNNFENYIWEPSLIKLNSIEAATSAACTILNVDETIKHPRLENEMPNPRGVGGMQMPH